MSNAPNSRRRTVRKVLAGLAVPVVAAAVITAGSPGLGGHRVKNGETLSHVAARYGTTVRTLVELNNLPGNGNVVYAGQLLNLPGRQTGRQAGSKTGKAAEPSARAASGRSSGRVPYVVKPGDTMTGIAKRFRSSLANLRAANGLQGSDRIYAGAKLQIPVKLRPKPAAKPKRPKNSRNSFAGRTYADHIVARADRNRAALRNRKLPTRAQMRAIIVQTARRHGVDPELALAISWQESGWKQRVVSPANAVGAMQVIPSTGKFTSSLVGRNLDLLRPRDNATAGVVLLDRLTGAARLDIAVAGYYQGLGGVRRNGMYPDTKLYVRNVLRIKEQLEKGWDPLT